MASVLFGHGSGVANKAFRREKNSDMIQDSDNGTFYTRGSDLGYTLERLERILDVLFAAFTTHPGDSDRSRHVVLVDRFSFSNSCFKHSAISPIWF